MNPTLFSKQKIGYVFSYAVLLILLLIFIILAIFNFQMVTYPFPLEYREGASLLSTNMLLAGQNPYDLAYQPEATNIYGIFYPLVVYPFAKIFGATVTVHRAVSTLFMFASCSILILTLRWMQVSLALSSVAALIFYWHLLLGYNFFARTDAVGLFLFLASIVIPWRFQYSSRSLIASILLGVLAFVTKPYFILAIPYIALYLFLFRSKQEGIRYGIFGLISIIVTILLLNYLFPTYFNNTFFVFLNIRLAGSGLDYAIGQLSYYVVQNFAIVVIIAGIIYDLGKRLFKSRDSINLALFYERINHKFNLANLREPLLKIQFDIFTFCFWLSTIIFVLKLGQFIGSWMNYMYHIISPFLIIILFRFISRKLSKSAFPLLCGVIAINLYFVYPMSYISNQSYQEWKNITAVVSQYKNIFNSPAIAPTLIQQGKKVYDSGHSEYFIVGAERKLFNIEFPFGKDVVARYNQFMEEVAESLVAKKYDLVVVTNVSSPILPLDLLSKCYEYKGTLPITLLVQKAGLDVWEPSKVACKR